jgi:hypothetical protein
MDIALSTSTHDIVFTGGELTTVTGLDAIAQHVKIRLLFFKGEWELNLDEGVPYWTDILVVGPDLRAVESLLRQVVLGTPGISSIVSFSLDHDRSARTLSLLFEAITTDGLVLTSADFGPFILEVPTR